MKTANINLKNNERKLVCLGFAHAVLIEDPELRML